jgi:long-chain acyl-CoA synthetase
MKKNTELTFPTLFNSIVEKFPECNALGYVDETPLKYKALKKNIDALILFLEKLNIHPGDKVAILSNNMPNWGISYLAITFMGAVAVPILPDFMPEEIENVLTHSECKAIFVSETLGPKLDSVKSAYLDYIISIDNFSIVNSSSNPVTFDINEGTENIYDVGEEDLAALIYTSGTTGNSKGVMLTHKNICFDAQGADRVYHVDQNDRFLSVLPLSHTYENTLGFILPMISGASVYYLKKLPTPAVLLPALKKVRPTAMLTVPLIMEKIYKNRVLPTFNKNGLIRFLYAVPFIRKQLNRLAGKKLMKTFGGAIQFYGIGGAKLNRTVEKFLIESRFPYAIGYGLTETSPLLAGVNPDNTRLQSTGPAIQGVEIKINKPDATTGEGEIWARGPNLMKGYYKEPELTAKVLTNDGWFKTGDLGVLDKDNFLYIKGRKKSMIVGSSGENIYPEEIESVINDFAHVLESLVIQQKGKLVALVHFNYEEVAERYKHLKTEVADYVEHKINELRKELHIYVNSRVNKFSQVKLIVSQPEPFIKTATQKIKRYLYT